MDLDPLTDQVFSEIDLQDRKMSLLYDLELAFGECAYEPSERGAGIAFNDKAIENALQVLEEHGVCFSGD